MKDLIPEGQLPIFQDLSFKLNFPTAKAGTFSIWGLGGLDENGSEPETDSTLWESAWDHMQFKWTGKTGVVGVKHKFILHHNTAIHTSLTASSSQFTDSREIYQPDGSYIDFEHIENNTSLTSLSSVMTHKFSAKLSHRIGMVLSRIYYNIGIRAADRPGEPVIEYGSEDGATGYLQGFSQVKWVIHPSLSLSGGIHSMLFF